MKDSRRYHTIDDDQSYIKQTWGVLLDDSTRKVKAESKFHWEFTIWDAISQKDLGQPVFLSFDSASVLFDTEGNVIPK